MAHMLGPFSVGKMVIPTAKVTARHKAGITQFYLGQHVLGFATLRCEFCKSSKPILPTEGLMVMNPMVQSVKKKQQKIGSSSPGIGV